MPIDQPLAFGNLTLEAVVGPPPWYENCYLVRHQDGGLLVVDPGADAAGILSRIGDAPAEAAVLLTHGHFDHLGAARRVQTALGVACRAHADERPVIDGAARLAASWAGEAVEAPEPMDYFSGEPTLTLAGIEMRVLHTPGHTPGGVCYLFDGFALTGDTLFAQGVGRTDLPGGDERRLRASISRLLEEMPEQTVLFSGHGDAWTAAEARRWWRWMGG